MSGDILLGLVFGFVLGVITLGTVHGYRYCGNCWVMLVTGRRYEEGCTNCCLKLCNQYPYHSEKVFED